MKGASDTRARWRARWRIRLEGWGGGHADEDSDRRCIGYMIVMIHLRMQPYHLQTPGEIQYRLDWRQSVHVNCKLIITTSKLRSLERFEYSPNSSIFSWHVGTYREGTLPRTPTEYAVSPGNRKGQTRWGGGRRRDRPCGDRPCRRRVGSGWGVAVCPGRPCRRRGNLRSSTIRRRCVTPGRASASQRSFVEAEIESVMCVCGAEGGTIGGC